MSKIWMLARANIRKTKSATITLVLMFLIASLLINLGLLVVVNYGNFFDTLKDELKPTDVYFLLSEGIYTDEVASFFDDNEHIEEKQKNDVVFLDSKIYFNGDDKSFNVLFNNMDLDRKISKWKLVGEHLPAEDMSIYVPDIFKAVGGYQLNDEIKLKYTDRITQEDETLTFVVKGYTEDIFFSSTDTGFMGFYVPEETYQKVEKILAHSSYRANIVFANVDEVKNISKISGDLNEVLKLNSASTIAVDASAMLFSIDLELIELARCMMATMVAAMMVVFSMVIVIVCLLVVRFRIKNTIEEDMMKIGSLKSIGYTSRQIISSVLLQFSLIAGFGSVAGIALSYASLPYISVVFEQQSGLKWEQGFDFAISAISFLILLGVVAIVAVLAARRIKNLNPINALRGETKVRRLRKNRMPLDKSRGSLSVTLAFKSILQNIKQNVMIIIILVSVAFSGAFGVIMFYNTTVDTTAFAEVPGFEICNALVVLNPEKDQAKAVSAIENMDNVLKTLYHDQVKLKVDGDEVATYVMEDYSKRQTNLVYEGRYPEAKNEITLAGILAERLEKTIGDTVTLNLGDKEETFKVVGLSNGSAMGGINCSILTDDYLRLNPDFKPQSLYIYLEKGTDAAEFLKLVKKELASEESLVLELVDFDKEMADGMTSYQNIVAIMGLVMLIITLLVVALVLYFVISSSVIRNKRELGIQKAIGYTTIQLMNQLSINFIMPISIGTIIGSLLGALYSNSVMSIGMKGLGVMKAGFIVDPLYITIFGLATIVFSYILSMLITFKIRKISAYALVTE